MERIVTRRLPDGSLCRVSPFHVCIKGLEDAVLCRDYDDYDAFVKIMCVSAWRKNVIIIIYAVVSNHCHGAVLAANQASAEAFIHDVKKVYSMWFSRKYGERNILHRIDAKALLLDTDWYVRNALAYIPRNALDNGCNINEYRWSGYRAMFSPNKEYDSLRIRPVSSLKKEERRKIMHTGDNLKGVPWLIDEHNALLPESFCDHLFLEQAFNNDQAFFLKVIGSQNVSDLKYQLEEKPYQMLPDTEMHKLTEDVSQRWFKQGVASLSMDQRIRLIPYLYRSNKTTVAQLARVLGLPREQVQRLIPKKSRRQ
ncbi:MAG: transposase [Bacteroidales bacterium]|nr:transposase [Bacteroidales bacterium]